MCNCNKTCHKIETAISNGTNVTLTVTNSNDISSLDCFNFLIEDIERGEGVEITSFSDNAIMYEYLDEAIVVYTLLSEKFVLFDSLVTVKIESKMNSYIQRLK